MRFFLFLALLAVSLSASPKTPKKAAAARNSVVSVLVYKNGELLRSGLGVFVGNDGEMFSSHSLFLDADSAVTVDARGAVRPVTKVLGADDLYDCVRLSVKPDKKLSGLELSSRAASHQDVLWLVTYGPKKSGAVVGALIEKKDTISGSHLYYTVKKPLREKYISAPLVNDEGKLVAIVQSVDGSDSLYSYALSASYMKGLTIKATNYNSEKFTRIGIRKALPATEEEALSCLLLQSFSSDTAAYRDVLDEFLVQYPASHHGYLYQAEYNVANVKNYSAACADWEKALSLSEKDAEIYYHKANTIYGHKLYVDSAAAVHFPLDTALVCVNRAIELDSQPIYTRLKGDILYTKRDFAAAFDCYSALTSTNLVNAEIYMLAANCKELVGDVDAAILHLDSAIATFGRVPVAHMAPYVMNRGLVKNRAGRYREAVLDYNAYANLLNSRVNANFYYLREQAEYNGKMYRQALVDIDVALIMEPENVTFLLEKGRVCYRVNMIDEALPVLEKAVALAPENPDVYYLLARCQMIKGNKAAAKENLTKAHNLGHPSAAATLNELK